MIHVRCDVSSVVFLCLRVAFFEAVLSAADAVEARANNKAIAKRLIFMMMMMRDDVYLK